MLCVHVAQILKEMFGQILLNNRIFFFFFLFICWHAFHAPENEFIQFDH